MPSNSKPDPKPAAELPSTPATAAGVDAAPPSPPQPAPPTKPKGPVCPVCGGDVDVYAGANPHKIGTHYCPTCGRIKL